MEREAQLVEEIEKKRREHELGERREELNRLVEKMKKKRREHELSEIRAETRKKNKEDERIVKDKVHTLTGVKVTQYYNMCLVKHR